MAKHIIQTVGDFTAILNHPLVAGGVSISLKGFKLDDTFVTAAQDMDNSKRIALVDQGTVAITNAMKMGKITFNAVRVSQNFLDGDLILIANLLQSLADNVGGLLRISYGFAGVTESVTFLGIALVSAPPLVLAGNDLPTYPIVFGYSDFVRGT